MKRETLKKDTEKSYISKRRLKALFHGILYYLCRIFPVKKSKILFRTFEGGGGFCCSPKYIAQEFLRRNNSRPYELVWIVDDMGKSFPEGIRKVKNSLFNRVYHHATSSVWVDNTRKPYGTKKRKNQLYIQTWHATICIKPVGLYRGGQLPEIARIVSEYDSGLIDYVLSGSSWCDNMYRKGLIYQGEIIRTGTPRCDIFFNHVDETRKRIRKLLNIPEDGKIMIYAPTFRGGSQSGSRSIQTGESDIDYNRLIAALERRFGGRWHIMLRLHPQLAAKMVAPKTNQGSERIVDVSQHPDMNELIAASDAFLTDYSSAAFEAAMMDMPVFIYADDLDEYVEDRGNLMFDVDALPYPAARNEEGLINSIANFNEESYIKKNRDFLEGLGVKEDGHASGRVADLIDQWLDKGVEL